jgi:hypothetical protein
MGCDELSHTKPTLTLQYLYTQEMREVNKTLITKRQTIITKLVLQ